MIDQTFYLGRDQRQNGLVGESYQRLLTLGEGNEEWANGMMDEMLVGKWLGDKLRLPPERVRSALPEFTSQYFGTELTPSQAYDTIVEMERQQREGRERVKEFLAAERAQALGQPVKGQEQAGEGVGMDQPEETQERDRERYPGWQVPRALGSGFVEFAQTIPAGLSSLAATATSFGMPDPARFDTVAMASPETAQEMSRLYGLQRQRFMDSLMIGLELPPSQEELSLADKQTARIQAVNAAYRDEVQRWSETGMGILSESLRDTAKFWTEESKKVDDMMGVDPAFANSSFGQFTKTVGSMPATMALMGWGNVGRLGMLMSRTATTTGITAMGGAIFQGVEQERMAFEGEAYDPRKALFGNLVSAGGQLAIERVIGVDALLLRALKETPKSGGRFVMGEFLRNTRKQAILAGMGEGFEETGQQYWNDLVASYTYDEARFDDKLEIASQYFWTFMVSSVAGGLMGTGVKGLEAGQQQIDYRRRNQYFAGRDGSLYNERDFAFSRRAYSDEEILSFPHGEILLRAVNGDRDAQTRYNASIFEKLFTDTNGATVYGGKYKLGEFQGKPAVFSRDGTAYQVFDLKDEKSAANWEKVQAQAALEQKIAGDRNAATEQTMMELQGRFGDLIETARPEFMETLGDALRSGKATPAQVEEIMRVAQEMNGLAAGLTPDQVAPVGKSTVEFKEGVIKALAEVVRGASPDVAVEEMGETAVKLFVASGQGTMEELDGFRREWFAKTKEADPAAEWEGEKLNRANIEWFSKRLVEYAVANRKTELPGGWGQWLRNLGTKLREFLAGAIRMRGMLRRGEISPEFERWLRMGLGLDAGALQGMRDYRAEQQARMQKLAELEEVFAKLPSETERQSRLLEEFELLKEQYRQQERADAQREIDAIAQGLNDRMRARDLTAARMEEKIEQAMELGVQLSPQAQRMWDEWASYSLEQVRPTDAGEQTFSLGRAVPADASNVVELPDGARLVGPTTFSIKAYHGTPYKVDKFKTANIGTGEGAQAYGWGLYFAENPKVAGEYQKRLSGDATKAPPVRELFGEQLKPGSPEYHAATLVATMGRTLASVRKEVSGWIKDAKPGEDVEHYKAVLRTLERAQKKSDFKERPDPGNLYTVELLPDEDDFLDWDAPLSQQGEKVKAALAKVDNRLVKAVADVANGMRPRDAAEKHGVNVLDVRTASGGALVQSLGGDIAASKALAAVGIPGIRFLDGGSRGIGQGTRNYVIFDEKLVRILEENGKPVGADRTFDPANPDITMSLSPTEDTDTSRAAGLPLDDFLAMIEKSGIYSMQGMGLAELGRQANENYGEALARAAREARQRRSGSVNWAQSLIEPIDYTLHKIVPEIARMLRERTFTAQTGAQADKEKVGRLADRVAATMNEAESFAFDQALRNFDTQEPVARRLAQEKGFEREFNEVVNALTALRQRAIEAGVPVSRFWSRPESLAGDDKKQFDAAMKAAKALPKGQAGVAMEAALRTAGYTLNIAHYFPRRVFDRDGLLAALRGYGLGNALETEIIKAANAAMNNGNTAISEEQLNAIVEKANAEMKRRQVEGSSVPGALKKRVIETVTADLAPFYMKWSDAAMGHFDKMHDYLATLEFFGESVVFGEEIQLPGMEAPIRIPESVGKYMLKAQAEGNLTSEQYNAVARILQARFNYKQSGAFIQGLRTFGYLSNMTQMYSFITASFPDMFAAGFVGGGAALTKSFANALRNASKVTLADIGEAETRINEEYATDGSGRKTITGRLQAVLGFAFKYLGMNWFTRVMKETVINSAVEGLRNSAQTGTLTFEQRDRLMRTFGEAKAKQVLEDLKAGNITDDVKFYAFNTLADWQPITLDQMPTFYLENPNGRIFYMYKTFAVTQMAAIRRFSIDQIVEGGRTGNMEMVAGGVARLGYLLTLLLMAGIPVDALLSFLTGRPFVLTESAASRLMSVAMLSRYTAAKLSRGEFGEAAFSTFFPSLGGAPKDLATDARNVWDAVRLDVDVDMTKLRLYRNIPIAGRTIDGWLGARSDQYLGEREDAGGLFTLRNKRTEEEKEAKDNSRRAYLERFYGN